MTDPIDLDIQIRARMQAAEEAKQRCRERVEQGRVEIEGRFKKFGAIADGIVATIVRPRLQRLVSHFDNARLLPAEQSSRYHVVCRFTHTERFPATVTLELSVSHDERVERFITRYNLEIMPVFFQFERNDETAQPLEHVSDSEIAAWVDAKLLQFVDTYLRLEMADAYQQESLVTDPVCGSRITKTCAAAQEQLGKATHYFCSKTCHQKFLASQSSS
jgi:YHS domain-containing protein